MSAVAGGGFRLLGDDPYVADQDPLGFDLVARQIANSIATSRDSSPFTIGIEGGWGSGKSSLMKRVEAELRQGSIKTVSFNAWTAEGASALEGLIKTVLWELDPSALRRAMRNKKLLRWIRVPVAIIGGWLRVGSLVDEVWDRFNADARTRNELRGLLSDAMAEWRDRGRGVPAGALLVVFVDDLDRASPTQVFEIFEAVKLYLDVPGLVFVIGYDHAVVSQAILEEKKYGNTVTGRDYLEKVIQVSYRIPRPDREQGLALLNLFAASSQTTELLDDAARSLIVERNRWNPRRIKRFLNSFVLEYAMDPDWPELGAQVLVYTLLLYMYFPEFTPVIDDAGENDPEPIGHFLAYTEERRTLRENGQADVLEQKEQALPPQYPLLAQNTPLVTLLHSLLRAPNADKLLDKLRRAPVTFSTTSSPSDDAPPLSLPDDSWSVLWLTTDMDVSSSSDLPVGHVTLTSIRGFRTGSELPSVIVVEPIEPTSTAWAQQQLVDIRENMRFTGPVVLFPPHGNGHYRQIAEMFDAQIVTTMDELVRIVTPLFRGQS